MAFEGSVLDEQKGLQGRDQNQARHQAPEAGDQRGEEDEFETAAFLALTEDRVAHDQERRRDNQQGDHGEGCRGGTVAQLIETRKAVGDEPIAGAEQPAMAKPNARANNICTDSGVITRLNATTGIICCKRPGHTPANP